MGKRLTIINEPAATYSPIRPHPWAQPARTSGVSVLDEYDVTDVAGLVTLETACAALDRAEVLRQQIAKDGLTITAAQGVKEHPLLRHENQARSLLLRALAGRPRASATNRSSRSVGRRGPSDGGRSDERQQTHTVEPTAAASLLAGSSRCVSQVARSSRLHLRANRLEGKVLGARTLRRVSPLQ